MVGRPPPVADPNLVVSGLANLKLHRKKRREKTHACHPSPHLDRFHRDHCSAVAAPVAMVGKKDTQVFTLGCPFYCL